jgi:O-antigen/teichoic acid export membrane protein
MKAYETILKGAGISIFGLAISKIISYLNVILIAKTGSVNLGLLNLGFSIISFVTIISLLGLNNGVLRYVSYYLGKKDKKEVKSIIRSALNISIPIGFIMFIVIFISSKFISINFFNKPELVPILKIFSIMIPLIIFIEIISGVFLSFKKIEYNVIIRDIIEKIIKLILILLFIYLGFNLNWVASTYLLSSLLTVILFFYILKKKKFYLFNNKIKSTFRGKELLIYSIPLIFSSLLTLLQKWADIFILGIYRTTSEIGVYSISMSTAALLSIFPTAIMSLFIPLVTNLYSKKKYKETKKLSIIISKWIYILNLPFIFILIIFSEELLKFVFGLEYIDGKGALIFLVLSYLLLSITHVYGGNLLMIKRTKTLLLLVVITTIVNLILNFLLIPRYGINGAAFSTLISSAIYLMLISTIGYKLLKLKLINKDFLKPFLIMSSITLLIYFLENLFPKNNFILVILILLILIFYFGLLFLTKSFNKEELNLIKNLRYKLNEKLKISK